MKLDNSNKFSNLNIIGIYSHYADADSYPKGADYT